MESVFTKPIPICGILVITIFIIFSPTGRGRSDFHLAVHLDLSS